MPKVRFTGGPDDAVLLDAKPGQTLLELAESNGVKMGSACGGACACSSCHCYVLEGLEGLEEATEAEEDQLDMAFDVKSNSRLGCQTEVGEADLVVRLTEESIQTWYNEHPDERSDSG